MLPSCSSISLTGSYPDPHHYAESDDTFEEVWERVVDYFAFEGIPISTIDKSSGLIITAKMPLKDYCSREENGKPLDPDAYVVIPTSKGGLGTTMEPEMLVSHGWKITGQWNVRVKESDGKTAIHINLSELTCLYPSLNGYRDAPIHSTGRFEQKILDYVAQRE